MVIGQLPRLKTLLWMHGMFILATGALGVIGKITIPLYVVLGTDHKYLDVRIIIRLHQSCWILAASSSSISICVFDPMTCFL